LSEILIFISFYIFSLGTEKKSMFSKACEYGIRAVIFINQQSAKKNRVSLVDIANAIASPSAFTAKILQKLVKSGHVKSLKGPRGGFHIAEETIDAISLHDIVVAIDGHGLFLQCCLGLPQCNDLKPCPMHDQYKEVRGGLLKMLKETTVSDLANQLEEGKGFLKQ
jgi:Rrf2 family iron-sulfur cluster assembly transcriptional regulator